MHAHSLGINCSMDTPSVSPFVKQISRIFPGFVHCYAPAGLPDATGQYPQQHWLQMADDMKACAFFVCLLEVGLVVCAVAWVVITLVMHASMFWLAQFSIPCGTCTCCFFF